MALSDAPNKVVIKHPDLSVLEDTDYFTSKLYVFPLMYSLCSYKIALTCCRKPNWSH
jgi:hypothetical protein